MPQNITDVDAFTAPIVFPADADPADLTYIETALQGLANRTRHLANRIGAADGASEWVYPSSRPRVMAIPLSDCTPVGSITFDGAQWVGGGTCQLHCPIRVPTGAVITNVFAVVHPIDTSASLAIGLRRRTWSSLYTVLTAPAVAYGTAAVASATRQLVSYAPPAVTSDNAFSEAAAVVAMFASGDFVEAVFVQFTDPGPRNY